MFLSKRGNCHSLKLKWKICFLHTISVLSPRWPSNVVLLPSFFNLLCFKKKKNISLKPAFYSRSLTYITRSMLHSTESKVFMIIPVSSKRQKVQCQDQFVYKTRSHPLQYYFCFVLFLMDNYIKRNAWFCYFGILIYFLWDFVSFFFLGFK